MKTNLKIPGLSALIAFLLTLPFMIMEVVNRQAFNEDFPFALFFGIWFNLFAFTLILLPIVLAWREGKQSMAKSDSAKGKTLIADPDSTALIGAALFLTPVILSFLDSRGWIPLQPLLNGPNPEQPYLPGRIITLILFSLPVVGGIIAGRPVERTLQAGGSLFVHPFNLIIIAIIAATFALGFASFIFDQWPCFMGVPNCD